MATKDYSNKQESTIADYLGWTRVAASGARDFEKGDIKSDDWLVEAKTHESETKITFNYKVWEKIQQEAMVLHKAPVLIVDDGTQNINHTWCLFSAHLIPATCNRFSLYALLGNKVGKSNINCTHEFLADIYRYREPNCIGTTDWNHNRIAIIPIENFKFGILEQN